MKNREDDIQKMRDSEKKIKPRSISISGSTSPLEPERLRWVKGSSFSIWHTLNRDLSG